MFSSVLCYFSSLSSYYIDIHQTILEDFFSFNLVLFCFWDFYSSNYMVLKAITD